nr:TonB-dependent receptor [Calditrichia bacterium]
DLLETSGKVFIQKSQLGGGSPMIRGFATNRVLIAVDGVRMNNAIFRSGNLQNVISLDPFSTDNTEVLFGPGSMIYGSDAIGGVMSFYTLPAPLATQGESRVITGSAVARNSSASFEKTGHLDIGIGGQKWGLLTSATFSDYDNLTMGSNGPEEYLRPQFVATVAGQDSTISNSNPREQNPTGYDQINLLQKIRFKPNEHWDFNLGFHYSTTSDYSRYDRLLRYRRGNLRSAEWYYGPQEWFMNALNIVNWHHNGWYDHFRATLAYQFFEESRHDRDFRSETKANRTEQVRAFSANFDFEKDISDHHRLFYGAEMILNRVASTGFDENVETGATQPAASRYPDGATWNSQAAYLNYRLKANEELTFQSGLRYNHVTMQAEFDTTFYPFPFTESDIANGAFTGSLGMVYKPDPSWQINANLSSGFRAPNVDDAGKVFDSEPGAVVVPNPDLKPEYAYNAELGLSKIVNERFKIELIGFYTYLDNALVRRDFTLGGLDSLVYDGEMSRVQAIRNAASATVSGIQAGIDFRLPRGFGLMSVVNFQGGEEELDDGSTAPLRHAAPFFGRTHLTYDHHRFRADLYGVYNGEIAYNDLAPSEREKDYLYAVDEDGNPWSPSWYTLNFKAIVRISDLVRLTAGVENMTDQRYRPYSSGIAAPGRNFIASLRVGF